MKYGAIILLKKYKHPGIKYSSHFSLFVLFISRPVPAGRSGRERDGARCGYVRLTRDLHPMICRSRRPIKMAKNTTFALKLLSILNYCPSALRFLCVTFNEARGRFSFLTYLAWFITQWIESCSRNSEFCQTLCYKWYFFWHRFTLTVTTGRCSCARAVRMPSRCLLAIITACIYLISIQIT